MKKTCGLLGFIFCAQMLFGFGPFNSNPYLTPTDWPTNSIYINWNTESEESTVVAYGMTVSLGDTSRVSGIRYYHHVELTGLNPGTQYYYKVLPSGDLKTFKTFPTHTDTFSFVAFGDTRSDSAAHHSVVDGIAACEYELLVHVGDLVNDGDSTSDWRIFFNVEDTILQTAQFLPVIGNHESPYWPYDTLFSLPGVEEYYSIRFGNSHFIQLNTHMNLYGQQRNWLIDELTAANSDTTVDWVFVNFHRPPYSSGNHGSQIDVRDAWCSLFAQYNVDIVFAGHDHDYERTIPIDEVVYIVTGGGGAPLRHVDSSSWTAYSESTYQFCHIEIKNRDLIMRAIKPCGTVFDSLFISKPVGIIEEQTSDNRHQDPVLRINPNPFNSSTEITFSKVLSAKGIELRIYDATGRIVKQWDNQAIRQSNKVCWDGRDNSGQQLPGGVYFLKYRTQNNSTTQKILFLRE